MLRAVRRVPGGAVLGLAETALHLAEFALGLAEHGLHLPEFAVGLVQLGLRLAEPFLRSAQIGLRQPQLVPPLRMPASASSSRFSSHSLRSWLRLSLSLALLAFLLQLSHRLREAAVQVLVEPPAPVFRRTSSATVPIMIGMSALYSQGTAGRRISSQITPASDTEPASTCNGQRGTEAGSAPSDLCRAEAAGACGPGWTAAVNHSGGLPARSRGLDRRQLREGPERGGQHMYRQRGDEIRAPAHQAGQDQAQAQPSDHEEQGDPGPAADGHQRDYQPYRPQQQNQVLARHAHHLLDRTFRETAGAGNYPGRLTYVRLRSGCTAFLYASQGRDSPGGGGTRLARAMMSGPRGPGELHSAIWRAC